MATAKKPAVKAPVKKAAEVKSLADLQKDLAAKQADLIEAKRSHRAGELVNPRVITATRKEIARLMTALTEASRKETK
ncbi:MAG TPA: 50S ribosomal protein L29 [Candidatus Saccharimonadaceae bacterium]|nr:50S ribosomal protein L29 [Candidatus Saccharimonadaceae bacterium]